MFRSIGGDTIEDALATGPGIPPYGEPRLYLPCKVDVITCAAADLRWGEGGKPFSPTKEELFELFERRWRRILTVAAREGAQVLILGAFGCGAFLNPPEIVAGAVARVLEEFDGWFETIEFAIYDRDPDSFNRVAFSKLANA